MDPFDGYGGGDGAICLERRHRRGLQVLQNSRLVEIVDEQELAATPRATREVLVTPFYNRAWPLLRYDSGALAEVLREGTRFCGMRLSEFARTYWRAWETSLRPTAGASPSPT